MEKVCLYRSLVNYAMPLRLNSTDRIPKHIVQKSSVNKILFFTNFFCKNFFSKPNVIVLSCCPTQGFDQIITVSLLQGNNSVTGVIVSPG